MPQVSALQDTLSHADHPVPEKPHKKIFVLDTNVLIHDPSSIFRFDDNDIVIPLVVIAELDGLKKGHGEIAVSARKALRIIDSLREKGSISAGIPLRQGGTLRVCSATDDAANEAPAGAINDDQIIRTALRLLRRSGASGEEGQDVILVSKDTAVRIKAETFGLAVEDYKNDKTTLFTKYGRVRDESDYRNGIRSVRYIREGNEVSRLSGADHAVRVRNGKSVEGIHPRNIEQKCALDALINPDIEVIALTGTAGTGKTLLALAAGIHQTTKKSPLYEQVVVARPVVPMGNDLGYLPGDISEKLAPWMQPIFDSLEVIVRTPKEQVKDNAAIFGYRSFQYLIDAGILQIEALTYIRGRSLPRRYFIIDEAQNLRPVDVKTIITRCGEGTKIVFTGDLEQIDTPYLDAMSNGLSYLISKFINQENFCFLHLNQSVRSRLAQQGAQLL